MSEPASNASRDQQEDDEVLDDIEQQAKDERISNRYYPRIFTWLRRPKIKGESLVMRTAAADRQDVLQMAELRIQAIELLFGLPKDCAPEWPGMLVFCSHLESCFRDLLSPQYEIIWKILHRPKPSNTAECWHWCFAVVKSFQDLGKNVSIERAYNLLLEKSNVSLDEKGTDKKHLLRAMFAVLCWSSATLKPIFDEEEIATAITKAGRNGSCSVAAKSSSEVYFSTDLRQPLRNTFSTFRARTGRIDESRDLQSNGGSSNHVLYQSSLDYSSLFTIGRVRLKWVDTLTSHLAFDRSTRTLSIFRFPSYCAINVLFNGDTKVLKDITTTVLPSHYSSDIPEESSGLHREVLLSYRLLFAQSSSSRRLLGQLLSQSFNKASTHSHLSTTPSGNFMTNDTDPFLSTICTYPLHSHLRYFSFVRQNRPTTLLPGTLFPPSALDIHGQLQEFDTYSVHDDFPVFGPRLLKLQLYNMRQQPSRVRDLWRDRRNPLQWYTFWAVLWIGGATIILALLQLLVGIVQIYVSVES